MDIGVGNAVACCFYFFILFFYFFMRRGYWCALCSLLHIHIGGVRAVTSRSFKGILRVYYGPIKGLLWSVDVCKGVIKGLLRVHSRVY